MKKRAWSSAHNVLCIRLDSMGDVLMTTPAFRAMKETWDGCRLTLLTSSSGAQAAALVPEVDEILVYAAPWMKSGSPDNSQRNFLQTVNQLREGRFDAAVIFTVFSQSALPPAMLCLLAGIPLRLAHCHENPYQLLTDWIPDPEPHATVRHEVRRQLDLVASVGCRTDNPTLSLQISGRTRAAASHVLKTWGLREDRPCVVIHPGATAPSRRYPPENFAVAAEKLALHWECQIVFTGSSDEKELIGGIRSAMGAPSVSLCGLIDIEQLAAVIQEADVLVSNNTGPVHIAAAVGTPVVDLYALTNPQHTPWMVPHRLLYHDVPCRFCYKSVCPNGHHDCLRQISPQKVVEATIELLFDSPKKKPHPDEQHRAYVQLGN